jgi:photosystem II stability/assembly factor-like uncharacterized protein
MFIYLNVSFSQSKWVWQNPLPQGNNLNAVWAFSKDKMIAVGELGTILSTEDGGINYNILNYGNDINFREMQFINEKIGWIISDNGIILNTNDRGLEWNQCNPPDNSYQSIHFINEKIGWTAGSGIKKTTDGGKNWIVQDWLLNNKIMSIKFIDSLNGWVSVLYKGIYRTVDGGKNWDLSLSKENLSSYSRSICFVNKNKGWACGKENIYRTTNGGVTWESYKFNQEEYINSIFFIDSLHGWAGSNSIYKTDDGGYSWNEQYKLDSDVLGTLRCIYFIDERQGFVVCTRGAIFRTINAGLTWEQFNYSLASDLEALKFVDEDNGWAVGKDVILHTDDGGKKWTIQFNDSIIFLGLDFVNKNKGWVVGYSSGKGKILATIDGGKSWVLQLDNIPIIRAIRFIDENNGFAVGNDAVVLKTTNGGKDWEKVQFSYSYIFFDVFFINKLSGFLCGGSGKLFITRDGGNSWTFYDFEDPFLILPKIQFSDNIHGWMTGIETDLLYKTTDGGFNWNKIGRTTPYNQHPPIGPFFFLDSLIGFAAGGVDSYSIYFTIDGGETWQKDTRLVSGVITDLRFVNHSLGYLVTREGGILKYSPNITNINELNENKDEKQIENICNYPNPFNGSTIIKFTLIKNEKVNIKIFNILGKEIEILTKKIYQKGENSVIWTPKNIACGIYFCQLSTESNSHITKILYVK